MEAKEEKFLAMLKNVFTSIDFYDPFASEWPGQGETVFAVFLNKETPDWFGIGKAVFCWPDSLLMKAAVKEEPARTVKSACWIIPDSVYKNCYVRYWGRKKDK